MLDYVCRTGTRLRSSTRIAVFHHYVTVRLADAVSVDLLVRLLATVPAADTLLADPGMTAPVLPFAPLCAPLCPPKSRRSRTTPVRSRPSQFLGLVSDFAKTEPVFESAFFDLRDPMIAGYSRSAERVAGGMWADH